MTIPLRAARLGGKNLKIKGWRRLEDDLRTLIASGFEAETCKLFTEEASLPALCGVPAGSEGAEIAHCDSNSPGRGSAKCTYNSLHDTDWNLGLVEIGALFDVQFEISGQSAGWGFGHQ
jgi:hypothetical protein